MGIEGYWLALDNIWVSVDQGNVVVSPVYFLYESALVSTRTRQVNNLNSEFKPLDLAGSRSHYCSYSSLQHLDSRELTQLQNILEVYLEMTRYLCPLELPQANTLYHTIHKCQSIAELQPHLSSSFDELNVEQFG
jgi:hypothetical protein